MYNLVMKDLKLGVNPWFFALPLLAGALMLIPAWVYVLVPLYFCFITVPNMLGGFKSQNDLMFSTLMPTSKRDIVKARIFVIVLLEVLHLLAGMVFSLFTLHLYPNIDYLFFAPHAGFWGICWVMLGIFNIILLPIYYKTAYKYGGAVTFSTIAAALFAIVAQGAAMGIPWVNDIFYGAGLDRVGLQFSILAVGILIFVGLTLIAYRISVRRFLNVEII
ncbi:ABC-2 transporter permease [Saccharibacillus kuerlensis]|uniref:Membrane protein n=1 Tax=Saccharibacillus kuerlensis TaxID=459527 RepID=A0ABQ2KWB3_9BACL|nr:ABC-2 transporter permease [Saccharibacillus kuerlensis]GGN94854.1 membrane protein [Saccharibacillus kuerlensis]